MTRKQTDPQKRGRKPWVFGTKQRFLESFKPGWDKAKELGGSHLTDWSRPVTIRFLLCYGDLKDMEKEDLPKDPDIPTDDEVKTWEAARATLLGTLAGDEAKKVRKDFDNLRAKIMTWYRTTYSHVRKADEAVISEGLNNILATTPKPRKGQVIQRYGTINFDSRFRKIVDTGYEKLINDAKMAHIEALKTDPNAQPTIVDKKIKFQNKIIADAWNAEPQAIRDHYLELVEETYKKELKEWEDMQKMADSGTHTPEQYQQALVQGAGHVERMAQGLQQLFGMNCTIMLCGPIASKGGRIEVRSIHAGTTKSTNLTWKDYDSAAFKEVEAAMIDFTNHCYSPSDCAARAVGNQGSSTNTTAAPSSDPVATAPSSTTTPSKPTESAASLPSPPRRLRPIDSHLTAAMAILSEADRKDCLARLHKLSDMEFDRENNMARVNALLLNSGLGLGNLGILSDYIKRPKKTIEELFQHVQEEQDHEDEAERMRREEEEKMEEEEFSDDKVMMDIGDVDSSMSSADNDIGLDNGGGAPGMDMDINVSPPSTPSRAPTPVPPPSAITAASEIINEMALERDDDTRSYDWDDVDSSSWWSELLPAYTAFKRGQDFPPVWAQLVDSFLVLESRSGFVDSGVTLPRTKVRPLEVGKWFKTHRQWQTPQVLKSVDNFVSGWWAWWKAMQPSGRRGPEDTLLRPKDFSWDGLESKVGRNGLVLVLLTLLWWGEAVFLSSSEQDDVARHRVDWALAVDDVTWAIDDMLQNAIGQRKGLNSAAPPQKRVRADKENIPDESQSVVRASKRLRLK
ncbi:hypothetical protein BDZ89DRAFT_1147582 [Hymenopellis radicata]|nr:hypothetical protein BDZ89DRAFT_1147582 [Hymenopellis radicata]